MSSVEAEWLTKEVNEGLIDRYAGGVLITAVVRADYELSVIDQMGYNDYFLVVADIVRHANEQGIRVGPGRGCLTGEVPVRTTNGQIPLSKVKVGDKVITHTGKISTVSETHRYEVNEPLLCIRAYYDDATGVTLTSDHKVLVEKASLITDKKLLRSGYRWKRPQGTLEWIAARDIEVGDLVVTPVPTPRVVDRVIIDLAEYADAQCEIGTDYIVEESSTNLPFPYSKREVSRATGLSRNAVSGVVRGSLSTTEATRDKVFKYVGQRFSSIEEWLKYLPTQQVVRKKIPRFVIIDDNFCKLMGMMVSNGWLNSSDHRVIGVAVRRSKNDTTPTDLFMKVWGLDSVREDHAGHDLTQYIARSICVRNFYSNHWPNYTYQAQSKACPSWMMRLPLRKKMALLEGLWWGDGSHSGKSSYSTTSSVLRDQVRDLLWSQGLPAGVRMEVRTDHRTGWAADGRISWIIQTTPHFGPMVNQHGWTNGRRIYTRVWKVEEVPPEPVYDITVPGDNSYATSSFVVHNSAAGSIVSYALGITELDPLEHGLIFERFLNPERPSMPDIDLDFDERRRGDMIRYVTEKYGEDHVAQIVTFSIIKTRAAIRDAAKVLFDKVGYGLAAQIIKALPPPVMAADIPLSGIFDKNHERYAEAAEVRALVESDPQIAEVIEVARGLEGLKRQWGVHASGVVICAEPLIDHIPIMRRDDGAIITQLDMNACEALGLVKMDFLGLKNLTIIEDALSNIKLNGKAPVCLEDLALDDTETYELLASGNTLGVFQLDGAQMRDLLRRLVPTCFGDISAVLSLYRPGPMGANAHNDYADRKNGRQEIAPIHPELAMPLADILDETFSVIVYQEQVMAIAQRVAGYTLGRADILRRAMGKKKRDVLDREYETFSGGMTSNGYSEEAIQALWDILIPFSDYAFGRGHAAGYGMISYWTAYLKMHYPAEYMAALLTSAGDNKDRMGIYLAECRRLGIKVTVPDINESQGPFTATNGTIRFGLAAVRDVGDRVVEAIVEGRATGWYENFGDFLRRVDATKLNSKALMALIRAGAFDSLGHPRRGLEDVCVDALSAAVKARRAEAEGLYDLFANDEPDAVDLPIPDREWTLAERLELEREMLGLYVSSHPLNGLEHILAAGTPIASVLDGTVPVDTEVTLVGLLASVTRKTSKKTGKPWAAAQLEDHAVGIELCVFARTFGELGPLLKRDAVVTVTGRVSQRDRDGDRLSVIVDRMSLADLSAPLTVSLPMERCTRELVKDLRGILMRHPGERVVRLRLIVARGRATTVELGEWARVRPGAELVGELTGLLGDGCLAG